MCETVGKGEKGTGLELDGLRGRDGWMGGVRRLGAGRHGGTTAACGEEEKETARLQADRERRTSNSYGQTGNRRAGASERFHSCRTCGSSTMLRRTSLSLPRRHIARLFRWALLGPPGQQANAADMKAPIASIP